MLEKENEDTIQSSEFLWWFHGLWTGGHWIWSFYIFYTELELCKRINEIEDRLNAQEKEIKEMKHALNASLEVIAKFDEKLGKCK